MALYTVRRTRVLRLTQTVSFEIEASTREEATEDDDDPGGWVEIERETLSDRTDVEEIDNEKD